MVEKFSYCWWVYIVKCRDSSYYCGLTTDLSQRLTQHNSGQGSRYTARRWPVALTWSREFPSEAEARIFEHKIKNWGKIKKEKLIRGEIYAEQ